MALLALSFGQATALIAGLGALLLLLTTTFSWRGQAYGRAVRPGLMAGVVPLVLPMLARSGYCHMAGACSTMCMTACIGGGLVAGAILGFTASAQQTDRGRFFASAAIVAALSGALGCLPMGAAGTIGMLTGLLVASTPLVARAALKSG